MWRDAARSLRRRVLLAATGPHRPTSGHWGYDRGQPIDRWYIEAFLDAHRADVHGDALEVKSDGYVRRYGTNLGRVHVLDVDGGNSAATVIGDLGGERPLPAASLDCFVLTQTLQYVWDLRAAVENAHDMLRPGGVLLLTVPSVARISTELDFDDLWRFTADSTRRLLVPAFGEGNVSIVSRGNLVAANAFLAGLAASELSARELDDDDERFPVVIAARAERA
jgi:SAM-dependent methyltransferase